MGLPVLSLIPKALLVARSNNFIHMVEEQWELVRPRPPMPLMFVCCAVHSRNLRMEVSCLAASACHNMQQYCF